MYVTRTIVELRSEQDFQTPEETTGLDQSQTPSKRRGPKSPPSNGRKDGTIEPEHRHQPEQPLKGRGGIVNVEDKS